MNKDTMSFIPGINAARSIAQRQPATPYGNALRESASHLADAAETLVQERRKPDPDRSDAYNGATAASLTSAFRARVEKARDSFNAAIDRGRAAASQAQDAKASLTPNEFAQETRTVFRGLADGDKAKFMGDAITQKDAPTVAALVKCPPHVAGLTSEMQKQYLDSYVDNHASSSVMAELDEVADAAKAVFDTLAKV